MTPDEITELRHKRYNGTVVHLHKVHSDLLVMRVRPDFPRPPHLPGQYCALGLGNLPGQDLLQRSFSTESEKVAQDSAYLAAGLYLAFSMIPVLIGMAGAVMLPGLAEPEVVVLELLKRSLSPWLLALLVAALVSGITSAASSAVLAGASLAGKNLLQAVPRLGKTARQRLTAIEGNVPSPFARVPGCPFHPRCQEAMAGRCEVEVPALTQVSADHTVRCLLYETERVA